MAKSLAKAKFGHPVYERYPKTRDYFYGIYEFDRTGLQKNEFSRLVERTANFFQTIAEASARNAAPQEYEIYTTIENRQSVSRHLIRERKGHAATLRKQHDNYICQVCRFDFAKIYGDLGEDFAEAHHIVPLKANRAVRRTTMEDLITVCSNCHRMLHRMNGVRADIKRLKGIVKLRKRD